MQFKVLESSLILSGIWEDTVEGVSSVRDRDRVFLFLLLTSALSERRHFRFPRFTSQPHALWKPQTAITRTWAVDNFFQ